MKDESFCVSERVGRCDQCPSRRLINYLVCLVLVSTTCHMRYFAAVSHSESEYMSNDSCTLLYSTLIKHNKLYLVSNYMKTRNNVLFKIGLALIRPSSRVLWDTWLFPTVGPLVDHRIR